jgi:hypothetical protein
MKKIVPAKQIKQHTLKKVIVSKDIDKPKYKGYFKPGVSGNPNGRPKKEVCIPDILRNIGKQQGSPEIIRQLEPHFPTVDFKSVTNLQVVLYTCYLNAERGDDASRSFIADRTEGKVKEHLAITDDSIVVDIEDAEYTDEPKKGEEIGTDEKDKSSDTPNS